MEKIRPQKIMLVITKSNWGGAQKYIYDLSLSYKEKGLDVHVAVGGGGELENKLNEKNITVHRLHTLVNDINIFGTLRSLKELYTLFIKESPDVIHLNSSKVGFVGGVAGRLSKTRTIIFTAHGWPFNEKRRYLSRVIFRILMLVTVGLSHTTICVSKKTKKDLYAPSFIKKKMVVIYNGISSVAQKPRNIFWETHNGFDIYGPKVVSIGELHTSKGYDLALSYFKTLKDIPWTYHIIGEGSERKNIESDIKKYGLAGRVFLYGHIPEASSYFSSFDLFFLPSRTESLGYVVIEAINTDIPVMAHKVGGVPEIIGEDEGSLLLNIDSRKETLDKISKALRKEYKFNTTKRELLRTQFSKETMVKETLKAYLI